jgi:hypothetical protein
MSYSGEWIYSIHSNLRKDSQTTSQMLEDSLPPSASALSINFFIRKFECVLFVFLNRFKYCIKFRL